MAHGGRPSCRGTSTLVSLRHQSTIYLVLVKSEDIPENTCLMSLARTGKADVPGQWLVRMGWGEIRFLRDAPTGREGYLKPSRKLLRASKAGSRGRPRTAGSAHGLYELLLDGVTSGVPRTPD